LLPHSSWVQISSSAPYSRKPSAYLPSSMWATNWYDIVYLYECLMNYRPEGRGVAHDCLANTLILVLITHLIPITNFFYNLSAKILFDYLGERVTACKIESIFMWSNKSIFVSTISTHCCRWGIQNCEESYMYFCSEIWGAHFFWDVEWIVPGLS
jgi:hypothetical protein